MSPPPGKTIRIALVDDDPAVRDALKILLETYDVSVDCYSSGMQLLNSAGRHAVDCLVLDLNLPDMSGIDVVRTLRRNGESVPAILISGGGSATTLQHAWQAGAHTLLEKPFSDVELLQAVEEAMGSGP
jgi:FixJ family two-component response regulator